MPAPSSSVASTPLKPLIVQGDFSLLLEVDNPEYGAVRDQISRFAELVKSPEYLHTYRITPLSVWNAASAGMRPEQMSAVLRRFSRYPVPPHVNTELEELASRFGRLRLVRVDERLVLEADEVWLAELIAGQRHTSARLEQRLSETSFQIEEMQRGRLKQELIKVGYPAQDLAGYRTGEPLAVRLRSLTSSGQSFALRGYQQDAMEIFYAGGAPTGGSGVVVLPCGAGKTMVGLGVIAALGTSTVVITTGVTASRQWIAELLHKTELDPDQVGEYTGQRKQIRPITITTYQTLTYRRSSQEEFPHFRLFDERNWGLIIYDEVHLLPAPVFQITAELQARRRLGLTATLIREDGRQDDVFALIGPKKYDVPWKDLERQGWIAKAICTEVRVGMSYELRMQVAQAARQSKFRLASENPRKLELLPPLLERHPDRPALIIGMYVEHLRGIAQKLDAPLLTGSTSARQRDKLYHAFRRGELPVLVVSKVANFAVDLPDASLAIQVSGTFGSRQEEAQRLGRILRPKAGDNQAHFYTLVSRDSVEQQFALNRQLFLTEQGYSYRIMDGEEL